MPELDDELRRLADQAAAAAQPKAGAEVIRLGDRRRRRRIVRNWSAGVVTTAVIVGGVLAGGVFTGAGATKSPTPAPPAIHRASPAPSATATPG
ncbi:MAG TPA: hypothetical protein VKB62_07080, partial [Streptosporangiaceae bacterium]|nr:hypothetical protein [Streptosporangiaceae bacterium]